MNFINERKRTNISLRLCSRYTDDRVARITRLVKLCSTTEMKQYEAIAVMFHARSSNPSINVLITKQRITEKGNVKIESVRISVAIRCTKEIPKVVRLVERLSSTEFPTNSTPGDMNIIDTSGHTPYTIIIYTNVAICVSIKIDKSSR